MTFSKLTLTYLLAFGLFYTATSQKTPIPRKTTVESFTTHERKLLKSFKHKQSGYLLIALVKGAKKRLNRKLSKAFLELNLYHLFSPSGLHLSSLFFCLKPLQHFMRAWPLWQLLLELFLALLPLCFTLYFPLKRITLLRVGNIIGKHYRFPGSFYYLFLLIFGLDFIWGTYRYSPLSFAYSFLFIGIIVSLENPIKLGLPYALFGGQLIASYFSGQPQLFLACILGFLLTALFTLIFPIGLVYYLIGHHMPFNWIEAPMQFYAWLVLKSYDLAQVAGYIDASLPLVLVVLILSMQRKGTLIYALALLLLIHSPPVNLPF